MGQEEQACWHCDSEGHVGTGGIGIAIEREIFVGIVIVRDMLALGALALR